jgi:hypothetical protein
MLDSQRYRRYILQFYLLIISLHAAVAADQAHIAIIASGSSDWFSSGLSTGCSNAVKPSGGTCLLVQPQSSGDTGSVVNKMQALTAAKKYNAIAIEASTVGFLKEITPVIMSAQKSGILTVAWTWTTIELGQRALEDAGLNKTGFKTMIGVDNKALVDLLANQMAKSKASKGVICWISFYGLGNTEELYKLFGNEVAQKGLKTAHECPLEVLNFDDIVKQVIGVRQKESIDTFVFPFLLQETRLVDLANKTEGHPIYISAGPDPYDLGYAIGDTIQKSLSAAAIPETIAVSPSIEISAEPYCDQCSCKEDTRCKRECPKCQ